MHKKLVIVLTFTLAMLAYAARVMHRDHTIDQLETWLEIAKELAGFTAKSPHDLTDFAWSASDNVVIFHNDCHHLVTNATDLFDYDHESYRLQPDFDATLKLLKSILAINNHKWPAYVPV